MRLFVLRKKFCITIRQKFGRRSTRRCGHGTRPQEATAQNLNYATRGRAAWHEHGNNRKKEIAQLKSAVSFGIV